MSDQNTPVTPNDDFDDLFEQAAEPVSASPTITVRTTSGDARYIPVNGPTRLSDVVAMSGLSINGNISYFMDGGTQITDPSTIIPVGASITIVGSVKGG